MDCESIVTLLQLMKPFVCYRKDSFLRFMTQAGCAILRLISPHWTRSSSTHMIIGSYIPARQFLVDHAWSIIPFRSGTISFLLSTLSLPCSTPLSSTPFPRSADPKRSVHCLIVNYPTDLHWYKTTPHISNMYAPSLSATSPLFPYPHFYHVLSLSSPTKSDKEPRFCFSQLPLRLLNFS